MQFTFRRSLYSTVLALALIYSTSTSFAQVLSVVGTQANGQLDALANDYLIPNPMNGIGIFDQKLSAYAAFVPGLLGSDFGIVRLVNAQEGTPHQPHGVTALIGNRAFINGDNTSTVKLKWKNTGRTFAVTDGHYAEIHTTQNLSMDLEVTGVQAGTDVVVYWSFDVFGAGSTKHDDIPPVEDSIKVRSTLTIDGANQFPNDEFDFGLPGLPGWREWKNVTGTLLTTSGTPFTITVGSDIDLWLAEPPLPPALGFGVDQNDGIVRGEITISVAPIIYDNPNNTVAGMVPLFSLDIGSDSEFSDPQGNANEVFDPGDLYTSETGPPVPVVFPWKDDVTIFGTDPSPVNIAPHDPAPVQSGIPIDVIQHAYFDLDGSDCIQMDLTSLTYGAGLPSVPWSSDSCIFESEYVFVSFDDDIAENYASPVPSIPMNSSSPFSLSIYSESGIMNEWQEYNYDIFIPASTVFHDSTFSESSVHSGLSPDPFFTDENDDDLDALDMIPIDSGLSPCTQMYFSADHEALSFDPINGDILSPSSIYQAGAGSVSAVITSAHHALPDGTDIDAFEFAWVWDTSEVRLGLALLFSVDDDDPLTIPNESGGLDPSSLYYSFLDSSYHLFSPNPLPDDIDGIAVWSHSLNGTLGFPTPVWGTKTWTGALTDQWSHPLNWFPRGVPLKVEDVIIPGALQYPIVYTTGHECQSIELYPLASLRVKTNVSLFVKN